MSQPERRRVIYEIIVNVHHDAQEISTAAIPEQRMGTALNGWLEALGLHDPTDHRVWDITNSEGVILSKYATFGEITMSDWLELYLVEQKIARASDNPFDALPFLNVQQRAEIHLATEPADHLRAAIATTQRYLPAQPKSWLRVRSPWAAFTKQSNPFNRSGNYTKQLVDTFTTGRMHQTGVIAFVSAKQTAGRTTAAVLLASMLASRRRERVVLINSSSRYSTLDYALTSRATCFVDDMARFMRADPMRWAEIEPRLSKNLDGLYFLPAPRTSERLAMLDAGAYETVIHGLVGNVDAIVIDCGTDIFDSITIAALQAADQLVFVTDSEPASLRPVAQAMTDVIDGFKVPTILLMNRRSPGRSRRLDLAQLMAAVPVKADIALASISASPYGAAALHASRFSWDEPPGAWEINIGELASLILGRWREMAVLRGT